jgi:hypothetical protein
LGEQAQERGSRGWGGEADAYKCILPPLGTKKLTVCNRKGFLFNYQNIAIYSIIERKIFTLLF